MKPDRRKELQEEMKGICVMTDTGKKSLYELCEGGITNGTVYWNYVEKLLPLKERTMFNRFHVVKKIHDFGFVFKNGFEIRHVPRRYFKVYEDPIKEIRERE